MFVFEWQITLVTLQLHLLLVVLTLSQAGPLSTKPSATGAHWNIAAQRADLVEQP